MDGAPHLAVALIARHSSRPRRFHAPPNQRLVVSALAGYEYDEACDNTEARLASAADISHATIP